MAALDGERVARFGFESETPLEGSALRSAFWLDAQRSVYLRLADEAGWPGLQRLAALQGELLVPQVAPALDTGWDPESGRGWLAVPALGTPLGQAFKSRKIRHADGFRIAWEGLLILRALGQAGVALPEVTDDRFGVEGAGRLWLMDLSGAEFVSAGEAAERNRSVGIAWARALAESTRYQGWPVELPEQLGGDPSWPQLRGLFLRVYLS